MAKSNSTTNKKTTLDQTEKTTSQQNTTGTSTTEQNTNTLTNENSESNSSGTNWSNTVNYKEPTTNTPVYNPTKISDSSTSLKYNTQYKNQALDQMSQRNDYINNALNQLEQLSSNAQNIANSYQKQDYTSQYQSTIDGLLNKILNREEFSYDFNADPMYNMYKDQYTKLGNEASMNAVANASAMTGGYGNSYAATAGAQANQQYMTQLNSIIPELYQAALSKYNADRENDFAVFDAVGTAEDRLYQQYRDNVSDSQWENQYKYGAAQDAISNYYNQTNLGTDMYNNAINEYLGLNNNELSIGQTNLNASQWADQMREEQNQFGTNLTEQQWEALMRDVSNTTGGNDSTTKSNGTSSSKSASSSKTDSSETTDTKAETNVKSTQNETSNTTTDSSGGSGGNGGSKKKTSGNNMTDKQIQDQALDLTTKINNAFDQMMEKAGLQKDSNGKALDAQTEYKKLYDRYTDGVDSRVTDQMKSYKKLKYSVD